MNEEGVAAMLGLVLQHIGEDVKIPEYEVAGGLPEKSRVVVYWEDSNLVIGIRKEDWAPDEQS